MLLCLYRLCLSRCACTWVAHVNLNNKHNDDDDRPVWNMSRLRMTLAYEFSDFRILTTLVFILGIPPTWRRVMTMTSMTSLHLIYTCSDVIDVIVITRRHVGGIISMKNRAKCENLKFLKCQCLSQTVFFSTGA